MEAWGAERPSAPFSFPEQLAFSKRTKPQTAFCITVLPCPNQVILDGRMI